MTDTVSIPTIPYSPAAEEGLLGSLLIDPDSLHRLALDPDDLYIERNRMVYQAMLDLDRDHQPVDYLTVCTRMDERKQLSDIGGAARVISLINATPTSLNAEGYAEIIRERARRRRVIETAQRLAAGAYDLASDLSGGISEAMDALAKSVVKSKGAIHIQSFVSAVYDEVSAALDNPSQIYGIPTGFIDVDRITYGLQRGEKLLLSGEPGVGKSVLAAQILINAAKCGHPGALYELEMSGLQVVRRAIAAHAKHEHGAGITTQRMRQGQLTDEEIPIFTAAVEAMSSLPIYISDASEMTTVEMRADIIRLKEQMGLEMVVVDYEGLLSDMPNADDTTRSKVISKRTHDIAKDLHVAMIAIGDMTKEGIKQQVRGQGAVAGAARSLHDADQIVIVRKGEQPNIVRLTWEKMREGESDRFCDLVRVTGYPMFESAALPGGRR